MIGILLDLAYQLACLVVVSGGCLAVLVAVEVAYRATRRLRAWWRLRRGVRRVSRQAALGEHERITGGVIAARRG